MSQHAVPAVQDDDDERRHPRAVRRALACGHRATPARCGTQWMHVTDVLPTLLDVLGVRYPERFDGYRTRVDGRRQLRAALRDAGDARPRAHAQHYELAGNRGYIHDGWKIVSLQPPGKPIDLDNWMLFDLVSDATEIHDLARSNPRQAGGARRGVRRRCARELRLSARQSRRPPIADGAAVPRSVAASQPRTFYPARARRRCVVVAPLVADRDYRARVRVHARRGDHGVIFALGDPIAGMALFARDGALPSSITAAQGRPVTCDGSRRDRVANRFELRHRALGARRGIGDNRDERRRRRDARHVADDDPRPRRRRRPRHRPATAGST